MAVSNSTPKVRTKSAAVSLDLPINVINERLSRAHATLDLMYTAMVNRDYRQEFLEQLCTDTLVESLHGAMTCIQEARDAANSGEVMANG